MKEAGPKRDLISVIMRQKDEKNVPSPSKYVYEKENLGK